MIPVFSSENAIKEEKKFLEVPHVIIWLMFSSVHMLFWHLVFQGGGAGQGKSAKVC